MEICKEKFEPDAEPRATHTCNLNVDHGGEHHCGVCGCMWIGAQSSTKDVGAGGR